MPKRIENLRESILNNAKASLLQQGYDALTIRGVAGACGIAVGTVYNYFPSKDMLTAAVMLEDWMHALYRMGLACEASQSISEALTGLYQEIVTFSDIYRSVWSGYSVTGSARYSFPQQHNLLIEQLADCIRPVLKRFYPKETADLPVFLAENLLICAGSSAMTMDLFLPIVRRILP